MARCGKQHMELDVDGIGKCSVPMWCMGMPDGFCNEPAYGRPEAIIGRRSNTRFDGYVPALACPDHGGPKSRVFMDGDQYCAVMPDFINLQESPAGFGSTVEEARDELERMTYAT